MIGREKGVRLKYWRFAISKRDITGRLTGELWIGGGSPSPTIAAATTTEGGLVNEVQRVGFTNLYGISSGTFTLTYDGQTTSALAWNASAATVKSALEALSNLDADEVGVVKTTDTLSMRDWQTGGRTRDQATEGARWAGERRAGGSLTAIDRFCQSQ